MNLVSVDPGFAWVKGTDGNGTTPFRFPHAIGLRARSTYDAGIRPSGEDMYIALPDGSEWAIGHTAMRESNSPVARADANWVLTPEYEAILCAALSSMFYRDATVALVVGLPVEHWEGLHGPLVGRLVGEHRFQRNGGDWRAITVSKCLVATQGMGAILNHALDENGSLSKSPIPGSTKLWANATVGVIDGGGLTANFSAYENLRELGKWTAGADLGLFDPMRDICRAIAAKYPTLGPTPLDVMEWLARGTFRCNRQEIDIHLFAEPILRRHADLVWRQANSVWRDVGRLDAVLLTGGQAPAIGPYIGDYMGSEREFLVVSTDPVFDNVRGWLKLLRYESRKKVAEGELQR